MTMRLFPSMKNAVLVTLALAGFLLSLSSPAAAQSAGSGSIVGTVKDPGGLVIPGADVTVKNVDTGTERRLVTTEGGLYSAPFLQPGRYEVRVKKEGFAEVIRQNLRVEVGATVAVDITLPLKAAQEVVTVTGEQTAVETEKVEVSQTINELAVQNLPLNGRRWDNLVLLTPGVSEDGGFGGVSFRGISSLYNNNMVDGSDNNQAFFSEARGRTRLPYVYSLSAIKEFNVTNAAYGADQGRAAGGSVNAVTKSGTNDMHGEIFYFIRDKAFLARDPTAKALGQIKPDERRQQFGAALGSRIIPDKIFYFLNYDQQKRNFPILYAPFDVNFLNTTISGTEAANCVAVVALTAACNTVIAALQPSSNVTGPRAGDNYIGLGKLDYQWDANNRVTGVANIQRWNSPSGVQTAPVVRGLAQSANGSDKVKSEFYTVTWNWVMTPTIVNEAKFQYGRDFESQVPNASGPQIQIDSTSSVTGTGISVGMPNFLPRGAFPNEKQFQWIENLSWIKGRHQFKTGFDVRHVRDKIQNLFQGGGIYQYSGVNGLRNLVTDLTTAGARNYARFVQAVDPITGDGRGVFSTNDVNLYFQDSWKFRPNLTVNLGLRYEVQFMPGIQQANPLVPESARLNTDTNNFGPRVGFAWSPGGSGTSSVRGGAGVYFGRTQNSSLFNHLFQNGVFQKTFVFNTTSCGAPLVPNSVFPLPSTAPAFGPIFGGTASATNPVPTATFANFAAFQAACPATTVTPIADTLDPKFANPVVYQYDIAYERELPWKLVGSVTFVGSRANRLPVFIDTNLPAPSATRTYVVLDGTGRATGPQFFTVPFFVVNAANPRPRTTANVATSYPVQLVEGESVVNSWYKGVVLRVKRRVSRGFTVDANYTWSTARDDGQVAGVNGTFVGTVSPLNPQNLRGEYGLSEIDIRNRFILNLVWTMPWGDLVQGKELKGLLRNWQAASVWRLQDGRPVYSGISGSPNCGAAGGGANTSLGGLTCGSASSNGGGFDGRVPFIERNSRFTTPGLETFDLRISREFKATERVGVEFLWEAFNIFNHTNFVGGGLFGVQNTAYDFFANNAAIIGTVATCSTSTVIGYPAGLPFGGCLVQRAAPRSTGTRVFLAPLTTTNTLFGARQMQFGLKMRF